MPRAPVVSDDPTALARCVGDPERFIAETWSRRVHHHRGGGHRDLLSIDDVDTLLTETGLRTPAFRLVRGGEALPPERYTRSARLGSRRIDDLIDVGRVFDEFHDGATVVLQGLHRSWAPLATFCRALEAELTHPVQANAYLTPPVATGLRVHADAHDVFALQTYGRKHWVTYAPGADAGQPGDPELDTYLEEGDSLYVPRGTAHAARTVDEPSLHITIGVRAVTWHGLLSRLVESAGREGLLDGALPPGWASDPAAVAPQLSERLKEAAAWLDGLDTPAVAEAAAQRFWASRPPALPGQLRQMLALDTVDDDTVVRRRPGATAHVDAAGADRVVLALPDRDLRLPAHVAPAIRTLLARDEVRVGDLSGVLDEPGRAVLARRLVREGLLTIVDE